VVAYFENVIVIELPVIRFSIHPFGCLKDAGLNLTKFILFVMVVSSKELNIGLINWLRVRGVQRLETSNPQSVQQKPSISFEHLRAGGTLKMG